MTPAHTSQPPRRGRDCLRLVLALATALGGGTGIEALIHDGAMAADEPGPGLIRTLDPLPPVSTETVPSPAPPSDLATPANGVMDQASPPSEQAPGFGDRGSGTATASGPSPSAAPEALSSASAQLIPMAPAIGDTIEAPPRRAVPPLQTAPAPASERTPAPAPLPVTAPPTTPMDPPPDDMPSLDGADVIQPAQHQLPTGVRREGDLIVATVGKAIEIAVARPFQDVVVPRPDVAEVIILQPGKVFVATRGVGSTNLLLVDATGRVVRNIEVVVEADLDGLRRTLAKIMPDRRVEVTPTQGGVVLTGQVRSATEADNVTRVAAQFAGGSSGEVINSLSVAGDQQVLLKVKVGEMTRSTKRALDSAFNINTGTSGEDTIWEGLLGNPLIPVQGRVSPGSGSIFFEDLQGNAVAIQALEEQRLIKVLAEPSLTAISGETANFLVGGEFPVPVGYDDDENRLIVEFKEFGVSLSFTPVVMSDNQISLRISTEVSRIAEETSIVLEGGIVVPGLSVRRANSTVMLPSGGSLMIAGLLRDEDRNNAQGFPGLKDLPILGAFFRGTEFENERTELVIIIQAFKVRPREFGPALALPTDGFVPADTFDAFLFGKLYKRYGDGPGRGDTPAFTVSAPIGYIME